MLRVAQASEKDTPAIEGILSDAVRWLDSIGQPLWRADQVAWERLSKDFKASDFHIAWLDGAPAACLALVDHEPLFWPDIPKGASLFIHKLAAKRAAAGKGLADALITHAKAVCAERGIAALRLDCLQDRPKLQALYERSGFARVGEKIVRGSDHVILYHCGINAPGPSWRRGGPNASPSPSLGMPALLKCGSADACLAACQELGLDFVELNMNLPWCRPESLPADLPRRAAEQGVGLTLHLPENLDPCEFDAGVATAWRETALSAARYAARHGLPVIVMHMPQGVYFTLPDRRAWLYGECRGHYLDALARFRGAMAEAIGPAPVKVGIEHTAFQVPVFREGVERLLESPVFGVTWDIGHSHSKGYPDREFCEARLDRLAHMHLHDARGADNHLPLGTGDVDLPAWLALAGRHNCRVVLETKSIDALRQSLSWLRSPP